MRGEFGEAALHALERPGKIDRGGASLRERAADFCEFGTQLVHGLCRRVKNAEGGPHGGSDADGRRAANDHFTDGARDFAVVGVGVVDFFGGKTALVEDEDAAVRPFDGLGYVHAIPL